MAATGLQAVTPSDTTLFNPPLRRIYVGVTGDVAVVDTFANTVVLKAAAVGWMSLATPVEKVKATSTTATNIVGDTNVL